MELSKYKYIYEIYISDDVIHIERLPIVYINQAYTYYKKSSSETLKYASTNSVYEIANQELLDKVKDRLLNYRGYSRIWCAFEVNEDFRKTIKEINLKTSEFRAKNELIKLENEIAQLEELLMKRKEQAEEMKKILQKRGVI